jgi:hypothetical protein
MRKNTLDILLKAFPPAQYALMPEVRDAAGHNASRSADFLIMGLWPSRGLEMIGIERKSFRGDWIKELKTPAKAENIYQYCDRWYLLTDNENVAKIEEIPSLWGWMHIDEKGKLKTIKEAPLLKPAVISRSFLACLLKRAADKKGWVTEISIAEMVKAAEEKGAIERNSYHTRAMEDYKALVKDVKEFEEITGINLINDRWSRIDGKKLGEAVKFILDGGIEQIKKEMLQLKNYHAAIGRRIEAFESLDNES